MRRTCFSEKKACLNCFKHAQKICFSSARKVSRYGGWKGTLFPFPYSPSIKSSTIFRAAIHALGRDVLIRAVESEAAGAEVRRRQPHVGKAAAVRSAANRFDKRLHARLFAGALCVFDQLHVVGQLFGHVVIAVLEREGDDFAAIFFVDDLRARAPSSSCEPQRSRGHGRARCNAARRFPRRPSCRTGGRSLRSPPSAAEYRKRGADR